MQERYAIVFLYKNTYKTYNQFILYDTKILQLLLSEK